MYPVVTRTNTMFIDVVSLGVNSLGCKDSTDSILGSLLMGGRCFFVIHFLEDIFETNICKLTSKRAVIYVSVTALQL